MGGPEVILSREALVGNLRALSARGGGLPLIPVIKADAYGHSAELVGQMLEQSFPEARVPMLAVARVTEARRLRDRGLRRRLLVLSEFSEADLVQPWPADVEVAVHSVADVRMLVGARHKPAGAHLNLNTGMNRLGFRALEESAQDLWALALELAGAGVPVCGLMSHLARAEEPPEKASAGQQKLFLEKVDSLRRLWTAEAGGFPRWVHLSNSPGLVAGIGSGLAFTAARPGIHLWGLFGTGAERAGAPKDLREALRPVACVRAPVRQIFWIEKGEGAGYGHRFTAPRRTLVGTVALGYADGIPRSLSRKAGDDWKAGFDIEGTLVPVLGTVSMDTTMVDLTDHPSASRWQAETRGEKRLEAWAYWMNDRQRAETIADATGTISYELMCRLGTRLTRRIEDGAV